MITHQDTMGIKLHPTQIMKHQMIVVVKRIDVGIVIIVHIEIVKDIGHQAQVAQRIIDLEELDQEDREEATETETP